MFITSKIERFLLLYLTAKWYGFPRREPTWQDTWASANSCRIFVNGMPSSKQS